MIFVPLSQGKKAIIDGEDYNFVSQWKWSFDGSYAVRGHYLGKIKGKHKYKKIYLHREINKTPINYETDHINKNKLDNRRSNLRSVKKGDNGRNRYAHRNNITGFLGVHWYSKISKYRASITVNRKRYHLGYYTKLIDAIAARRKGDIIYGL